MCSFQCWEDQRCLQHDMSCGPESRTTQGAESCQWHSGAEVRDCPRAAGCTRCAACSAKQLAIERERAEARARAHSQSVDMEGPAAALLQADRKKIVLGTRRSPLALVQTREVQQALQKSCPEIEFELKEISTTGDKILDVPLAQIGDKGLFTKELELALLRNEIDLAVHSLKVRLAYHYS